MPDPHYKDSPLTKSHLPELEHLKKQVITSSERGVDIRLASTSITNPHCKGQIFLWPDTLTLTKLSTHAQQVVQHQQN
jgi:hypothetical protein